MTKKITEDSEKNNVRHATTPKPKSVAPPKPKSKVPSSSPPPPIVPRSIKENEEAPKVPDMVIPTISVESQNVTELTSKDFNSQIISLLEALNSKLELLLTNKTNINKLSDLSLNELKVLRELANEAVIRNKFPGGDEALIKECSTLAFKTDQEVRNRLKIFQ